MRSFRPTRQVARSRTTPEGSRRQPLDSKAERLLDLFTLVQKAAYEICVRSSQPRELGFDIPLRGLELRWPNALTRKAKEQPMLVPLRLKMRCRPHCMSVVEGRSQWRSLRRPAGAAQHGRWPNRAGAFAPGASGVDSRFAARWRTGEVLRRPCAPRTDSGLFVGQVDLPQTAAYRAAYKYGPWGNPGDRRPLQLRPPSWRTRPASCSTKASHRDLSPNCLGAHVPCSIRWRESGVRFRRLGAECGAASPSSGDFNAWGRAPSPDAAASSRQACGNCSSRG